jgi:hypothetical protein
MFDELPAKPKPKPAAPVVLFGSDVLDRVKPQPPEPKKKPERKKISLCDDDEDILATARKPASDSKPAETAQKKTAFDGENDDDLLAKPITREPPEADHSRELLVETVPPDPEAKPVDEDEALAVSPTPEAKPDETQPTSEVAVTRDVKPAVTANKAPTKVFIGALFGDDIFSSLPPAPKAPEPEPEPEPEFQFSEVAPEKLELPDKAEREAQLRRFHAIFDDDAALPAATIKKAPETFKAGEVKAIEVIEEEEEEEPEHFKAVEERQTNETPVTEDVQTGDEQRLAEEARKAEEARIVEESRKCAVQFVHIFQTIHFFATLRRGSSHERKLRRHRPAKRLKVGSPGKRYTKPHFFGRASN